MPFYTHSSALYYWLNNTGKGSAPFPGALLVIGDNTYGELGVGDTFSSTKYKKVGNLSWSSVATGSFHTAAIRSDGLLFTWGYNLYGQLRLSSTTTKSSPVQVASVDYTQLVSGFNTGFGLNSTGTLYGWGLNGSGPVGLDAAGLLGINVGGGTIFPFSTSPVFAGSNNQDLSDVVQIGSSSWTTVNSGLYTALVRDSSNQVYRFGPDLITGSISDTPVAINQTASNVSISESNIGIVKS